MNANAPWWDPSSPGPGEGGDPPAKQGWMLRGIRVLNRKPTRTNQGHPPPTDTTPHHPRFPGGAVEGGGGPRKVRRAWGGRFPAIHLQFPGRGGCRWWTGVVSRLRPDPIVWNAPTIPRGIRLTTRTWAAGRMAAERRGPWHGSKPIHRPHPLPPITGKRVGRPAPPGVPEVLDPWGLGRETAGVASLPSNQAPHR